ncbi:MAG: exo-alpha-sialidase [Clostridia bacterium]|nr:exo-alpha-sialidase [Clostridia bacterium]
MLVTDKAALMRYRSEYRMWQGIPAIERTAGGRIFAAFYSGGETECMGNFAAVVMSSDGGETFSEPIAVADMGPDSRAFDSALWIDPLGRLWFAWAVMPDCRVEFSICENPDADELVWGAVRTLGYDIMLNKPIVAQNGDWLFPVAVWKPTLVAGTNCVPDGKHETGAHVYRSRDMGETFEKIGTVDAPERWYDEHMLFEKLNGDIEMYIRTRYGVGKAVSKDGGSTWGEACDSGLGGPNSRFYIGRLKSGRVLLVNHYNFTGRNNLTAFLSDDDGATFSAKLLIDGRNDVSYPDVCQADDGAIYIIYDRERGAKYVPGVDYSESAREILMAKITEDDILAGKLVHPESRLRMIVSALGRR